MLIDIEGVIQNNTHPRLRSDCFINLLMSLLTVHSVINEEEYQAQITTVYEQSFNGQVIMIEHYLNDKYDSLYRRIYISDYNVSTPLFLHNNSELAPPLYLHNKSELAAPLYVNNIHELSQSFTVFIPIGIITNMAEFKHDIEKLKLKSKIYNIVEV